MSSGSKGTSGRVKCGRVALVVTLASAGLLVWSGLGGARGPRPVVANPPDRARVWEQAAAKAFGRRVLLITAKRGTTPTGGIFEADRSSGIWALYDAAPGGSTALETSLFDLAQRAAETFDKDRRKCAADVERALDLFAVKTVVYDAVELNTGAFITERQDAEPVQRLGSAVAAELATAKDPVALAAGLRTSQAMFLDWDDALWGGALNVEVKDAGPHVFPFGAEGARVVVDGVAVASPSRAGPLLVLDLPKGNPRVEVTYDGAAGQSWVPVAGIAGLVLGLLAFLISVRPTAAEIEASA